MTLCFPQLGAESDWRTADTASFKETAQTLGIKQLVFSDAQQKQENQISAVRACIQQGVDVIALPPVVEDGWDAVLNEAKNANIPVIIVDRSVSADPSLYASHIGSDMELEGQAGRRRNQQVAPRWRRKTLSFSGTTGSGAAVGRAKGFAQPSMRTSRSSTPRPVTSLALKPARYVAFLRNTKPAPIPGLFIHNDDMGIGAIEALKAAA